MSSVLDYSSNAGLGLADAAPAINAALASGSDWVDFPRGDYLIATAVAGGGAGQRITFAPGARLIVRAPVAFTGARQRIDPMRVLVDQAATDAFAAVTVSGVGARLAGYEVTVSADVPNVDLLRVSGARARVRDVEIIGAGKAFRYGVHAVATNGSPVDSVVVDSVGVDVGDDGAETTYGALVYLRANYSEVRDVHFSGAGRSIFPNGLIIVDGLKNTLRRPKIFATRAKYGVNRLDQSEFLEIYGGHIQGRNNGTYEADSEGVRCGHVAGHLKMHGVSVTGFVNGVVTHGSHDSPNLVGCTIVNNREYPIKIDSEVAGVQWGVRGLNVQGCYLADVYGVGAIHFASGSVEGCVVSACEMAYQQIGIQVEDGFGTLEGVLVQGCRIAGGMEGATPTAIIRPGANSSTIRFQANKTQSIGALATGPYAAKAVNLDA